MDLASGGGTKTASTYYTLLRPPYNTLSTYQVASKQAEKNSTRSLIERRVDSLGNLNKSSTVRNTRGLPFNAPYACTGMHRFSITILFFLILPITTNDSLTQPRGELLLGLPTLLTTHHVNAESNRSAELP